MYAAIDAMARMCTGEGEKGGPDCMDGKNVEWASWTDKIDFTNIDLVGHSFGGATLVSQTC
jgi:hypothetical protein